MDKSTAKWKAQPLQRQAMEQAFGGVPWRSKTPEIRAIPRMQGLRFPKYCCQSPVPKAVRETKWSDLMDWTIMRGNSVSSAAHRALNVASHHSCLVSCGWHSSPGTKQRPQLFPATEPKFFTFLSPDLPLPLKGGFDRPLENRRTYRCHKDKKNSLFTSSYLWYW